MAVSLLFQQKQSNVAWDHCPEHDSTGGWDRWSHPTQGHKSEALKAMGGEVLIRYNTDSNAAR